MANSVEICNMALSNLGSSATVSSISPPDGSVEAGYCARFYALARKMTLTMANWHFATKRATLAQVTNPSTVWAYAYARPANCLRIAKIFQAGSTMENEDGSALFEMEDSVILTNEPEAVAMYVQDVVDTTRYSPEFVTTFSEMLTSYLAGPILKGEPGSTAANKWRQLARADASAAAAADANRSHSNEIGRQPNHIKARL